MLIKIKTILLAYYYKIFKNYRTFYFQNNAYKYFYHWYNNAWENERSIEIPLVMKFLKDNPKNNILEVGNVLSHYFQTNHDIIDKYEQGVAVINQDITKYNPQRKYDLIVSISTLEHVGWDEKPLNPKKILTAINKLKNLLNKNGKIIFTLPIGYNFFVDELISRKNNYFTKLFYFKKYSNKNDWKEIRCIKNNKIVYNYPFSGANTIVLGIINKQ